MSNKHDVRKGLEIGFADGITRTVRPLTIKQLRKFVKIISKMEAAEKTKEEASATSMSDEEFELMIEAAGIILEKCDLKLATDPEAIEDAVDLHIFNQMMNIAMGNSSPEE